MTNLTPIGHEKALKAAQRAYWAPPNMNVTRIEEVNARVGFAIALYFDALIAAGHAKIQRTPGQVEGEMDITLIIAMAGPGRT